MLHRGRLTFTTSSLSCYRVLLCALLGPCPSGEEVTTGSLSALLFIALLCMVFMLVPRLDRACRLPARLPAWSVGMYVLGIQHIHRLTDKLAQWICCIPSQQAVHSVNGPRTRLFGRRL